MKKFSIEDLVSYLRSVVEVQAEGSEVEDTGYLAMSDEDLILYLRTAVTRDYSQYSLKKIPEEAIYPILLLARRELYFKLATISAPLYNLTADGASLSQTQRFEHYMQLIKQIDSEYQDYEENGGSSGTVSTYNVSIANRYATRYNEVTVPPPAVSFYIDNVGDTFVEVSWESNLHKIDFKCYKVYISSSGEIFDEYEGKVSENATLVSEVKNIWHKKCRIKGLTPNTSYYVGVVVDTTNGKKGHDSDSFTTEEVVTTEAVVTGV